MKSSKGMLRTLLLSSLASAGMPVSAGNGVATPYTISSNKREEADEADVMSTVMDRLTSGTLSSSVELADVDGHTSHSSHSSHASHVSSSSSSTESKFKAKDGLLIGGVVAGGVGIYFLFKWIAQMHSAHIEQIEKYRYSQRSLHSNQYGHDVDKLVDLLKKHKALSASEASGIRKKRGHYVYDKSVKKSVKKMQRRMGVKRSGKRGHLHKSVA